jgi:hypothetical protein
VRCFVDFATKREALAAADALDGLLLDGHRLKAAYMGCIGCSVEPVFAGLRTLCWNQVALASKQQGDLDETALKATFGAK